MPNPITAYKSSYHFLIIGKPGTGKTYSLLTLPRPLLILDAEGGLNTLVRSGENIDDIEFESVTDFDNLNSMLDKIDYSRYKSIAIDTYSALQSFHLMKKYVTYNRENLPYNEWNYVLIALKNLFYNMRSKNVIFVVNVHEKVDNTFLSPVLQGQSASEIFVYVDFAFRSVYLNGEYLWKIRGENEPLKFRGKIKQNVEYIKQDYSTLIKYLENKEQKEQ